MDGNFLNQYLENIKQLKQIVGEFRESVVKDTAKLVSEQEATKAKAIKDADFAKNSEKYLTAKKEELIKHRKQFDALKTNMRQSLSEINFRKLERLDVKDHTLKLFEMLNRIVYKSKEQFNWNTFRDEAIKKDRLDDFKAKLAAFDFSELPPEQLQELENLIHSQVLKDYIEKDPAAEAMLELYDFLDCIPAFVQSQREIKALENNIAQIKRDTDTREIRVEISKNKTHDLDDIIKHLETLNVDALDNKLAQHLKALN